MYNSKTSTRIAKVLAFYIFTFLHPFTFHFLEWFPSLISSGF